MIDHNKKKGLPNTNYPLGLYFKMKKKGHNTMLNTKQQEYR